MVDNTCKLSYAISYVASVAQRDSLSWTVVYNKYKQNNYSLLNET